MDDCKIILNTGLRGVKIAQTRISDVDGDAGRLIYRGYLIQELASRATFEEVAYLLLFEKLPSRAELLNFKGRLSRERELPADLIAALKTRPANALAMDVLQAAVSMLANHDPELPQCTRDSTVRMAIRLIAKMPTLVAMAYKYGMGQPYMYPRNDLSYAGNFLRMMFGTPCEDYKVNPVLERALDRIFILHADHEQNASTSTVRLCGSSGTNPFAAIAAGVACLWGPAHGGANEACLNMLEDIQRQGGVAKVGEFMEQVKDKNSGVKLMGFGHRVYKNYDPRAKLMQETCDEVLAELGLENDPLFKLAKELEKIALEDEYFVSRKLYPNVDFYSGIVQRAIGIPVNLFTGIFTLARTVGWIAQLNEMISDSEYKIGRPRQLFTGSATRNVKPVADR